MLLGIFHTPSKKEEGLINSMVCSVWSTFQKVQRVHELEFSYAYLCYCCVTIYADFKRIVFLQRNIQISFVTLILCF